MKSSSTISPSSLPDLIDREGIVRLVDRFYERVRVDDQLGPVFSEVAKVNWERICL